MANSPIIIPDNYTLQSLAEDLGVELNELLDMSLDEIGDYSVHLAQAKADRINQVIENRNDAFLNIRHAQEEVGITQNDLKEHYFKEIGVNK